MGFIEEQQLESAYVMGTYARKPVELVRGRGMQVEDSEGRTYLDFVSGVGAVSLGHCHPALVSAIEEQASTLVHVSNYYYIEHRGEVAHLVSDLLNECVDEAEREPWQSFFANSGAEANECAFKLARLHAKKRAMAAAEAAGADEDGVRAAAAAAPRLIVTLDASFHGRTLADGFVRTPINDIKALESLFASQGDGICAVMVECVQGESGVHPCTAEFLAAVRRLTAECGALFMCDEIQCGMYRCGTHPFGFQHFGVTPDVVTIAKGIASGFPMGMCAARAQVAASFDPGDHGSTFGGSCLAVAAAEATVRALAAEDAAGNAERTGAYLREKLTALPQVEEVRGLGLMVACDLAEGVSAPDVVLAGLDEGLLLNFTGPRTLRFLPPLVCSKEDVDVLVQKLAALLS